MGEKFELIDEFIELGDKKLYRIRALKNFADVKAGDIGGFIEKEENLDQTGNAWVSGDAMVSGNARVFGNSWVCCDAMVYDNARVYGNASVYGNAWVYGDAWVYGNARVYGYAMVYGDAQVYGNAWVYGDAQVYGNAWVYGNAEITKQTHILQIGPIGSRDDFTTFFRTKEKQIYVKCGCFCGRIDEFEKAVKQTHSGTKHEKTYLLAVDLAKTQVELE